MCQIIKEDTIMQSPISRLGGKRLLAKTIVNQFPKHNTYVEPFCGAAWVFYTKEPSKVEILNDINGDLISFYRCIINHKEEFIRCFSDVLKHRDIFDEFRFKDRKHMTDIQKAVALVYTTKHSFSSKGENYCPPKGKSRFSLDVFKSRILDAYERLRDTYIENQHYSYILNDMIQLIHCSIVIHLTLIVKMTMVKTYFINMIM
jgi:DNA adenine methylase